MKTLYIMRHAKSSWDDSTLPDHERPLNARGERDTPVMGRLLKKRGIHPDLILTSTAVRALQTARGIAHEIGYPLQDIRTDEFIYHASGLELVGLIAALADTVSSVMLVGHNPAASEAVDFLTGKRIGSLPTCTVAALESDAVHWDDLAVHGSCRLLFMEKPKRHSK
ncbi:MAG: histidine phosphatase family protein [Bacteroidota bacterium]|nr:histidine phosphatase family protein [Bacteroidota bacterium]